MNFLRKLAGLFSGSSGGGSNRQLKIYVLSRRCNEPLEGQVDLFNELSQTEDDRSHGYYTRKVLHTTGESRCFDQVEVNIWFDNNKNVAEYQVEGGRWLTEEEYQVELARFHAPPDDEHETEQMAQDNLDSGPRATLIEHPGDDQANRSGDQENNAAEPPDKAT